MKTLEEITEIVAKELGYNSFEEFLRTEEDEDEKALLVHQVAKRYAEQTIDRCYEIAFNAEEQGDLNYILNVKQELK